MNVDLYYLVYKSKVFKRIINQRQEKKLIKNKKLVILIVGRREKIKLKLMIEKDKCYWIIYILTFNTNLPYAYSEYTLFICQKIEFPKDVKLAVIKNGSILVKWNEKK